MNNIKYTNSSAFSVFNDSFEIILTQIKKESLKELVNLLNSLKLNTEVEIELINYSQLLTNSIVQIYISKLLINFQQFNNPIIRNKDISEIIFDISFRITSLVDRIFDELNEKDTSLKIDVKLRNQLHEICKRKTDDNNKEIVNELKKYQISNPNKFKNDKKLWHPLNPKGNINYLLGTFAAISTIISLFLLFKNPDLLFKDYKYPILTIIEPQINITIDTTLINSISKLTANVVSVDTIGQKTKKVKIDNNKKEIPVIYNIDFKTKNISELIAQNIIILVSDSPSNQELIKNSIIYKNLSDIKYNFQKSNISELLKDSSTSFSISYKPHLFTKEHDFKLHFFISYEDRDSNQCYSYSWFSFSGPDSISISPVAYYTAQKNNILYLNFEKVVFEPTLDSYSSRFRIFNNDHSSGKKVSNEDKEILKKTMQNIK